MAKKFQKSKNAQVQAAALAKTRHYLFDIIYESLDKLDTQITSSGAENLTDQHLAGLALLLQLLASRVETLIVQKQTDKIVRSAKPKKKTPRPKARRKG